MVIYLSLQKDPLEYFHGSTLKVQLSQMMFHHEKMDSFSVKLFMTLKCTLSLLNL
jgi:hypothetical protein